MILSHQYLAFQLSREFFIDNSSFLNNQGTPLTVKNKPVTYLTLKGEIHFINNTGVLGGACGLHNIIMKIEASTEVKIIFEGNTGVYGGALYLKNAFISDRKCKLKIEFINNTATKSGKSVYFATIPQVDVTNCSFKGIHTTDISSPAFDKKQKRREMPYHLSEVKIFTLVFQ